MSASPFSFFIFPHENVIVCTIVCNNSNKSYLLGGDKKLLNEKGNETQRPIHLYTVVVFFPFIIIHMVFFTAPKFIGICVSWLCRSLLSQPLVEYQINLFFLLCIYMCVQPSGCPSQPVHLDPLSLLALI